MQNTQFDFATYRDLPRGPKLNNWWNQICWLTNGCIIKTRLFQVRSADLEKNGKI